MSAARKKARARGIGVGVALLVALSAAGCGRKAPAPTDGGTSVAAPAPTPLVPMPPQVPFDPKKLRCAQLLPEARASELAGFPVRWRERRTDREGVHSIVCTHRGLGPDDALSFQLVCLRRGKRAPDSFEALRAHHASMPNARSLRGGVGIVTATSHLAAHPYRPCYVQLAFSRAASRPASLDFFAGEVAARLP